MSDERRKDRRVPAKGPCTIVGGDGEERAFELVDLSESGARLTCETAIAAMTRVQMVIVLPADRLGHTEDARLDTVGVVVWSHKANETSYDTGVFFSDLEDDMASLLRNYVATAV
jgi:c-di-GMP-binding flagellar brake protein YcgR